MACLRLMVIFAAIAAVVPTIALAKEFIVGDEIGWTFGFDYQAWAAGKNFRVGDKLVFQYPAGAHNVFKVNGTGFQNCIVPPQDQALTSGNDTIVLATPGRKWYICGVGKHCAIGGQKLVITVQPESQSPSPASAPQYWGKKYTLNMAPASQYQAMKYSSDGSKKYAYLSLAMLLALATSLMI